MLSIVAIVAADSAVNWEMWECQCLDRLVINESVQVESYLSAVAVSHFHLRFDCTAVAVVPCAFVQ